MDDRILRVSDSMLTNVNVPLTGSIPNIQTEPDPLFLKNIKNSHKERERREKENEQNLRISAQNSREIVEKLQVQINQKDEDLQNQREQIHMLKQQLSDISRTLSDLFIIEENNLETHEKATILAKEIYACMIQSKKVDWKALLIDKGPDVLLTAIPLILQLAKLI